jgi:hypothetical protein
VAPQQQAEQGAAEGDLLGCRHGQRDANGRLEAAAFTDAPFRK